MANFAAGQGDRLKHLALWRGQIAATPRSRCCSRPLLIDSGGGGRGLAWLKSKTCKTFGLSLMAEWRPSENCQLGTHFIK